MEVLFGINKIMKKFLLLLIFVFSLIEFSSAETIKIGIPTVLSGDFAIVGEGAERTVQIYQEHELRHDLKFIFEDAKLSSTDGFKAYQKLINFDHVNLILGMCTSNATMASKSLINSSHTPTVSISTGGYNIDQAGDYVYRIGNSDVLNGINQSEYFIKSKILKIAILAEETEYTQDIAIAFRKHYLANGGEIVFDQDFMPGTTDFKSLITALKVKKPSAIFMPTQTGTALGLFLKQLNTQTNIKDYQIHTTFVAAPNADARKIAGDLINGVYYLAPEYQKDNPRLLKIFQLYQDKFKSKPGLEFHAAGLIDILDLLQIFLDSHPKFETEAFNKFLISEVKDYQGLLGKINFDADGNTDLGFKIEQIK